MLSWFYFEWCLYFSDENVNTKSEDDEAFVTTVQTNDSGDVIVARVKKTQLEEKQQTQEEKEKEEDEEMQQTLVLNHRGSLDPESSLKRDIDEYMRVMEKQDKLPAVAVAADNSSSRRNSLDVINEHKRLENNVDAKSKIDEEDDDDDDDELKKNDNVK